LTTWSIRSQILVSLVLIQTAAVTATAWATAAQSARRSERQIVARLDGVIATLGRASFPYTGDVLHAMRGLSGAEFAAYGADGSVSESTLNGLTRLPTSLSGLPPVARLSSIDDAAPVELSGRRYRAAAVRRVGGGPSVLVLFPESTLRQARLEAAAAPVILGGLSLLAMAAATGSVAYGTGSRIRALRRHVARIAEGDFSTLDAVPRADEVGDLTRSINEMTVQLRGLREATRRSERARLLAQLGAGLAHQLRNALTGARMSVQLHARRCTAAAGDESLDVALRQLSIAEDQVRGLLTLGRVESKPAAPCDLRDVLADVARLVLPACRHARVEFRADPPAGPLEAVAEPSSVRSALLNLTLNAIEAAGPGGLVELDGRETDGEVTLTVSDTGPGPPPELAGALCEPFVTGKPEGVGLGLALAEQVAAEHGGRLSWSRDDATTCFRLSIPRHAPTPAPGEAAWTAS
jgi:signal transduction histidine kinase